MRNCKIKMTKTKKEKHIMKNRVKFTAAALAAIMTVSCAAISSSAVYTGEDVDYADGEMHILGAFAGGWSVDDSDHDINKNPDALAAFNKATKELEGVDYEAIALLGSQVVAGMNYAILCRSKVVYPDAQPEIKIMYVYADLEGNAEITGFKTIIGEQLAGGFTANDGEFAAKKNDSAYSTYKKVIRSIGGTVYKAEAYLGSQVVAGTNYMMLCRSRTVLPGTEYEWSLVTVNKDLEGKATLVDIENLVLGDYDDDNSLDGGDDIMAGIANPWSEYDTVAEAAKAAGVEFSAPEKIDGYTITLIQAMEGIVDVRYTDGENEITIRKGTGTDDISGDYNTYKNVSEKKINGNIVTLKGNDGGISSASWTDGKNAFSVFSEKELSESFMESIIAKIS